MDTEMDINEFIDLLPKALNGITSGNHELKTLSEIQEEIGMSINVCCCEGKTSC